MLKGHFLKNISWDKSSTDIKEIQPTVDSIHAAEQGMDALSADQLREKSTELKARINKHVESLQNEIEALKAKAATMPESDLDAKEAVFVQIDKLEEKINEELEVVLEDILPEAFALIKETARRFSSDEDVEVTALQYDRDIAAKRDIVRVEGDKAYWANTWSAAGSHKELEHGSL